MSNGKKSEHEVLPDSAGGLKVFREVKEREEWNEAVAKLGGSVLQSWEWGEFREQQGWRPLRLLVEGGAVQALFRDPAVPGFGCFGYAPYGPAARDLRGLENAVLELERAARKRGAVLVEIEPRVLEESVGEAPGFSANGFVRSQTLVQPRCTFVLEVLEDEEKQLAALPKDARYGVRRAGRQGVVAGPSREMKRDLELFLELLEETGRRQSFAVRPREYYRRFMQTLPAHLIVARREGEKNLLAGAIVLTFGEEAVYLYGASSREGENLYASYLAQFEALSAARREGVRRYDLGGVPCNPSEDHPLWGVYKFKKKFGGREERYIGAHEKRLRPLRAGLLKAGMKGYYSLQRLKDRGSGPISD